MSEKPTRREVLGHAARGTGLLVLGGAVVYLTKKAGADGAWAIDPTKCVNIRLGATGVEVCDKCATNCVLPLSAVRAVNEYSKCGRCCICPAYYDVASMPDEMGLPTGKMCPRDALKRRIVGEVDELDPNNNYYEYTVDEALCDGCGKCVKTCQPPFGNGSLRLEIRYNLCYECDACTIQVACPEDAVVLIPTPGIPPEKEGHGEHDLTT